MSQRLTVCRIGKVWAARDVTGAHYGHSNDLFEAIAVAERLASHFGGGTVVLTLEAETHLRELLPKAACRLS